MRMIQWNEIKLTWFKRRYSNKMRAKRNKSRSNERFFLLLMWKTWYFTFCCCWKLSQKSKINSQCSIQNEINSKQRRSQLNQMLHESSRSFCVFPSLLLVSIAQIKSFILIVNIQPTLNMYECIEPGNNGPGWARALINSDATVLFSESTMDFLSRGIPMACVCLRRRLRKK